MQVSNLSDTSWIVGRQLGRIPRTPFRPIAYCAFGFPQAILSPSMLDDGTRFPNWAYLCCPYLIEAANRLESHGRLAMYRQQAIQDGVFADSLRRLDEYVRAMRRIESDGLDVCEGVGIAGQTSPLGIKCLHAHIAYALAGAEDTIGLELLVELGADCSDGQCFAYAKDEHS